VPEAPYRILIATSAGAAGGSAALTTLDAYRQQGGYTALRQALTTLTPVQVLEEIRAAHLRGRGGAGVLTAEKLAIMARAPEALKYLVCNAYDADPRSLIASTLLSQNPHAVIEGMILAGYAIGASEGFLYMRGDRDVAAVISRALQDASDAGILGRSVLGARFAFSITLAGTEMGFMGGEESILLQILKGRPAKAQQRPPYPTQYGYNDQPTVVQNVETLANLPVIVARGADAYKRAGTQMTPGTKLFTVLGPDGAQHVVEVPFGTSIAGALQAAGIAVSEANARAVVIGGMEGGALPLSMLNTPLDFEPIEDAGAIIGSSVIEVLPRATCMVHYAMERSGYLAKESCGKCVPCRVGVMRVSGTLQGITSGIGTETDMALLEEFSRYIPDGSLCGFGVNAIHPVATAMKYFADDFAAHLDGRCPTDTCLPVRSHRYVTKHVL
jgi:NADH:ubiquinone oxidoreductase subunit F (NADH-binding)